MRRLGRHPNSSKRDQRGTKVKQENDADEADNDGFGDQVTLESLDGFFDEP